MIPVEGKLLRLGLRQRESTGNYEKHVHTYQKNINTLGASTMDWNTVRCGPGGRRAQNPVRPNTL